MTDITWTPVRIRLGQIEPWEQNPRQSSKTQVNRLVKSERELGQPQTLAVSPFDGENMVQLYDGHQRVKSWLPVKGAEYEVWVLQASRYLSDDERRKIAVLLHTATGGWSWDVLSGWSAAELGEWGFDRETLRGWQNDATALKAMLASEQAGGADAEAQIDRAAELLEKWQVSAGDLWQIGDHRLICGDCTDAAVVARVIGREKAQLMLTSPPYHVGKGYEKDNSWDDFVALIHNFAAASLGALSDSFAFINFGDSYVHPELTWHLVWRSFLDSGFRFFDYRAWKRPAQYPIYVTTQPRSCPELEFLHTYTIGKPSMTVRDMKISASGVWETGGPEKLGHDAAMSVDLADMAIKIYTDSNDTVYEPFSGSGTTLVACENLRRRCRAVEISPPYIAVALQRMADAFPGIEIKRLE